MCARILVHQHTLAYSCACSCNLSFIFGRSIRTCNAGSRHFSTQRRQRLCARSRIEIDGDWARETEGSLIRWAEEETGDQPGAAEFIYNEDGYDTYGYNPDGFDQDDVHFAETEDAEGNIFSYRLACDELERGNYELRGSSAQLMVDPLISDKEGCLWSSG